MTRTDALSLLKKFEAAFPGQRGNRETHDLYVGVLTRFEREAGEDAATALIEASVFWPAVSEVKAACERASWAREGANPAPLLAHARILVGRRKYTIDEAKADMLASFRENAEIQPDGPWRRHIKTLGGALIVLLLLLPGVAQAGHKHNRCPQHSRKNLTERTRVVRCWANERNLDAGRVVRIARCESGTDLLDDTAGGLYSGTFQQARRYWPDRARNLGAPGYGVRNVWAQAKVSTAMMRHTGYSAHWPYCGARA